MTTKKALLRKQAKDVFRQFFLKKIAAILLADTVIHKNK
jgi:hypothetical protein